MPAALVQRLRTRFVGRHAGRPAGTDTLSADATADDGGFVLIEALAGLIIFAIVAVGATAAILGGIRANSGTQNRVGTSNVAQQELEKAEALPRASLTAQPTATSTATVGTSKYTVTRTVTYSPVTTTACPTTVATDAPHAMVVHVSVTGPGQNARTVAIDTVIAC